MPRFLFPPKAPEPEQHTVIKRLSVYDLSLRWGIDSLDETLAFARDSLSRRPNWPGDYDNWVASEYEWGLDVVEAFENRIMKQHAISARLEEFRKSLVVNIEKEEGDV
jgi:hypothetical protein